MKWLALNQSRVAIQHNSEHNSVLLTVFYYTTKITMLVKKGQNIKIINLHDNSVIYTSRFVHIHQDSYIYITIRIYTSRFVYIHQDSYIYIKIRIYTSRFVYIHQDSYIYIKIRIYTSRFVYIQQDSYIYIQICIYTLRFVQFGHKGKHGRWIDYRVFKRRSKSGSK